MRFRVLVEIAFSGPSIKTIGYKVVLESQRLDPLVRSQMDVRFFHILSSDGENRNHEMYDQAVSYAYSLARLVDTPREHVIVCSPRKVDA